MTVAAPARRAWLLAGVLAVCGVSASVAVGFSSAAAVTARTDEWLGERGQVVEASIEATVKTAIDGLSALAAFFENSADVDREEFAGFVNSLDPKLSLLGAAYVPIVPAGDIAAHEAAMRNSVPGYTVFEYDESNEERPVSGRSVYYPVDMLHRGPFLNESLAEEDVGNQMLGLGFDAGSAVEWNESIEHAIASDAPSVSSFLEFGVNDQQLGKVFMVLVPVHDGDGDVVGLVGAPMVDLVLTVGADMALTRGIEWSLKEAASQAPGFDRPSWSDLMAFPGTTWRLDVVPTDAALRELDGTPLWMSIGIGLVLTGVVVFVSLLIAQRRRARIRLAEMERFADEKDRFLASVSHELRTPLTVVSGIAHELSERGGDFDPSEATELLELIARQSDEVAAIVEDLLVASRADIGRVEFEPSLVDLGEELGWLLDAAGIDAEIVGSPSIAWSDSKRIRQIVRNLMSNTRRYGGPEMQVRFGGDAREVWVEVADSGPPIPANQQSAMFDAYVTSSDQTGPSVGAMGLGLFISQRLAELLGGTLRYHHDGSFVAFRLTLPAPDPAVTNAVA